MFDRGARERISGWGWRIRRSETIAEVYRGFVRGDDAAVREVQGWIAKVVFGGNWRFRDGEAVAQEALVRLLQIARQGRVRDEGSFQKFVYTVAKNVCVNVYHAERSRVDRESLDLTEAERAGGGDDPHRRVETRERFDAMLFVFQRLPERCQKLWDLVYARGMSAADVAAELGISAANVRVRVHRCLQRGREIFAGRDAWPAGVGR